MFFIGANIAPGKSLSNREAIANPASLNSGHAHKCLQSGYAQDGVK